MKRRMSLQVVSAFVLLGVLFVPPCYWIGVDVR